MSPDLLVALASWRRTLEARGLSADTVRMYGYGVFRFFWDGRIEDLTAVTEDDVVRFLIGIGRRSTARIQYTRGLSAFFRYLLRRGLVQRDPTAELRLQRPHRPPPVALSEEELTRVLLAAAWRDERRAWALMLVFGLGARRMEVEAIRPEDVQGDYVLLRQCKFGKQRRVELSPIAKAALEGLRPWYNGTVLGGIRRQMITEWAHQAAEDSGLLEKVRRRPAHVLRASFITYLLRRGVPVQVVRDLVGHANIATTNEYAAVESEERQAAVALLDF